MLTPLTVDAYKNISEIRRGVLAGGIGGEVLMRTHRHGGWRRSQQRRGTLPSSNWPRLVVRRRCGHIRPKWGGGVLYWWWWGNLSDTKAEDKGGIVSSCEVLYLIEDKRQEEVDTTPVDAVIRNTKVYENTVRPLCLLAFLCFVGFPCARDYWWIQKKSVNIYCLPKVVYHMTW